MVGVSQDFIRLWKSQWWEKNWNYVSTSAICT